MKRLVLGCAAGILGLVIMFYAVYSAYLNDWRDIPELILGVAIGWIVFSLAFKVPVEAVKKWDNF